MKQPFSSVRSKDKFDIKISSAYVAVSCWTCSAIIIEYYLCSTPSGTLLMHCQHIVIIVTNANIFVLINLN